MSESDQNRIGCLRDITDILERCLSDELTLQIINNPRISDSADIIVHIKAGDLRTMQRKLTQAKGLI